MMASLGAKMPRMKKTGTTIVGLVFKVSAHSRAFAFFPAEPACDEGLRVVFVLLLQDGIVLGADTRATEGDIVRVLGFGLGACGVLWWFVVVFHLCLLSLSIFSVLSLPLFGASPCLLRADCGQELPKDSLHGSQHLVLWRGHGV